MNATYLRYIVQIQRKKQSKRQIGNPSLKSCFVSHKLFKIASCPKVGRDQSKNFSLSNLFYKDFSFLYGTQKMTFFLTPLPVHRRKTSKQKTRPVFRCARRPVDLGTTVVCTRHWDSCLYSTVGQLVACSRHWGSQLPALDIGTVACTKHWISCLLEQLPALDTEAVSCLHQTLGQLPAFDTGTVSRLHSTLGQLVAYTRHWDSQLPALHTGTVTLGLLVACTTH